MNRVKVLRSITVVLLMSVFFLASCNRSRSAYRDMPAEQTVVDDGPGFAGMESLPKDIGRKDSVDHRIAYTVGPDDVLRIEVRQEPEYGGEYVVSPEGTIFVSLIGSVEVKDATTGEIADRLQTRLSEFIRDPEVGVSVLAYNSKKVYVLGQVRQPGEYNMKGNVLSVREAVLDAGLPLDTAALHRVAVITPDVDDPMVVLVDVNDILYKGIMRENIDLKPGDIVVVHRNIFAKLGAFLDQILGPTSRVRSVENIVRTFGGDDY